VASVKELHTVEDFGEDFPVISHLPGNVPCDCFDLEFRHIPVLNPCRPYLMLNLYFNRCNSRLSIILTLPIN
jgi:hypothetical protein